MILSSGRQRGGKGGSLLKALRNEREILPKSLALSLIAKICSYNKVQGLEDSGLTLPPGAAGAPGLAVELATRPWVVTAEPPRHPLAFLSGRCPTGPTDAALEVSELPAMGPVQAAAGRYLPVRSP